MLRFLFTILLTPLLLFSMCQMVSAYWLETKQHPFSICGERENAPPSNKNGIFTIQKNDTLNADALERSPILLPHSDYFIPADIIDANVPIFSLFSHPPLPAKDPLANLLYANLRVKKLLDEYAEIKTRARDLLGQDNLEQTGRIDISEGFINSLKNRVSNTESSLSLFHELLNLQSSLELSNVTNGVSFWDIASKSTTVQLSQHTDSSNTLAQNVETGEKALSTSVNENNLSNPGKMNGSEIPQYNRPTSSSQARSNSSKSTAQESYSGNISLPWLIDLPSIIFNYFLDHPILVFFIVIFILLLLNVIFGSRLH